MALLQGAFFAGLWLAFIGWFLLSAAHGSVQRLTLERELSRVPVAVAMEPLEPTVRADATVADVLEGPILSQGHRSLFVRENGHVEGLVTLHQIKEVLPEQRASTPVRDITLVRPQLVTTSKNATLWQAFTLMNEAGIGQIPVEQGGELVGMVTRERLASILHNLHEFQDDSVPPRF